jgi:hypothetical protein
MAIQSIVRRVKKSFVDRRVEILAGKALVTRPQMPQAPNIKRIFILETGKEGVNIFTKIP